MKTTKGFFLTGAICTVLLLVGCESAELKECKAEVTRQAARCSANTSGVAAGIQQATCNIEEVTSRRRCEERYGN